MKTETTPYVVRETELDGFEVWQEWWNRRVAGPFPTREEAEAEALRQKEANP